MPMLGWSHPMRPISGETDIDATVSQKTSYVIDLLDINFPSLSAFGPPVRIASDTEKFDCN